MRGVGRSREFLDAAADIDKHAYRCERYRRTFVLRARRSRRRVSLSFSLSNDRTVEPVLDEFLFQRQKSPGGRETEFFIDRQLILLSYARQIGNCSSQWPSSILPVVLLLGGERRSRGALSGTEKKREETEAMYRSHPRASKRASERASESMRIGIYGSPRKLLRGGGGGGSFFRRRGRIRASRSRRRERGRPPPGEDTVDPRARELASVSARDDLQGC